MRLSLGGADGRHTITIERHHRVGVPGETSVTVKINAGPVIRLTAEQETLIRNFFNKPTTTRPA